MYITGRELETLSLWVPRLGSPCVQYPAPQDTERDRDKDGDTDGCRQRATERAGREGERKAKRGMEKVKGTEWQGEERKSVEQSKKKKERNFLSLNSNQQNQKL